MVYCNTCSLPFNSILTSIPCMQLHPNPKWRRQAHLTLKHYEFAGKVVGKCLYECAVGEYPILVKARFTRSFLAQIIGLRINYKVEFMNGTSLYPLFRHISHLYCSKMFYIGIHYVALLSNTTWPCHCCQISEQCIRNVSLCPDEEGRGSGHETKVMSANTLA